MAEQTKSGKSFEYACLISLYNTLKNSANIIIEDNKATITAKQFFKTLSADEQNAMLIASQAAINVIIRLEPRLEYSKIEDTLYLSIQEDSKGQQGDVRDVLCIRELLGWEIGFSCKHNHSAVKHSRLSEKIDFGEKWFGYSCSTEYFFEISPLFQKLEEDKKNKKLWRDLPSKEDDVYIPLLNAFVKELQRLYAVYQEKIPSSLITYLLGRNDFYKIIAKSQNSTTQIQVFNFFGTLNQSFENKKSITKVPISKLPDKIFDISYKKDTSGIVSKNTIIITCNNGWAVSMRIHNASSKVEPSLKFDVTLVGTPSDLYSVIEPW